MSKSSARVIRGGLVRLLYHNYHHIHLPKSNPPSCPKPYNVYASAIRAFSSRSLSKSRTSFISQFHSKPTSSNALNPHIFSSSPRSLLFHMRKPACNPISNTGFGFGNKFFSTNPNLGKRAFWNKPAAAISSTFSRYREAMGLQIEAFFRTNSLILIGAGGLLVCVLLWRIMFGIANTFIGLSEGMAKYGFLALSSAIVVFAVSSF